MTAATKVRNTGKYCLVELWQALTVSKEPGTLKDFYKSLELC